MSVIEDTRKMMQDFLAPELRQISARLDGLEKRLESSDRKIDQVDLRAEKRHVEANTKMDQVKQRAEKRHEHLSARLDEADRKAERRHDEVMMALRSAADTSDIKVRLARVEERQGLGSTQH